MKRIWLPVFVLLTSMVFVNCRHKKKEKDKDKEDFFPVLSIIKSQVAHVDSSFYPIRKITFRDSLHADTVYYKREQFRELASDFLNLPDISDPKFKDRFTGQNRFDETLNKVILTYLPINPEQEELRREEVLVQPDPYGNKVKTIIIDYFHSSKDSSIEKRLLWKTDQSFQVVTTRQLPGQPDSTTKIKVTWNEEEQ